MKLINNDCIAAMKEMPDNSVDSIVTDPPYELGFMGKSWDSTGIAFNVEVWQEALRVLKPGGHLIAFSGSRTYHRMAVAIEDAGFEIRDQIMWVYGSGFPKSLNISKAIDKAAGLLKHESKDFRIDREGTASYAPTNAGSYIPPAPQAPEVAQWQGWGTALKPAHEPMVLARKPIVGTVANNVLTYGVGGLNIDGSRVGNKRDSEQKQGSYSGSEVAIAGQREGGKVYPIDLGRWPANFIHDGSWEVVELFPDTNSPKSYIKKKAGWLTPNSIHEENELQSKEYGDSGSAARFFYCAKTSKRDRNEGLNDDNAKQVDESRKAGSKGGNNPRNRGANERTNFHPTVKPTDLMRYLCKLVTPPGGTVLDPFMGSGSTGKGAVIEGFDFIGIEMNAEYLEIAKARIAYVQQ